MKVDKNQRRSKTTKNCVIHEFEMSSKIIDEYFPDILKAFPCTTVGERFRRSLYMLPVSLTIGICRHQHRDNIGESTSSTSLNNILKQLLSIREPNVRYNFVILGDRFIFARIPSIKDLSYFLLTKHISLANKSPDVRFAGEFWCDEFGRWRVNNNSGTYRPADSQRENAVRFFQQMNPKSNIKIGSRSPVQKRASERRSLYF